MNQKYFELIQVLGIIAVIFFFGFSFGITFDYFTDGEISYYPLINGKEIEQNEFQFTVRCYIK